MFINVYGNRSIKKTQNLQCGFHSNISHAYSSNAGIENDNVVPYHSSKILLYGKKHSRTLAMKMQVIYMEKCNVHIRWEN